MVRRFAGEALFGLLTEAWRRPVGAAGLGEDLLRDVLAHLHVNPPEDRTPVPASAGNDEAAAGEPRSQWAVRALECLLDYAASRARTDHAMPASARPAPACPCRRRSGRCWEERSNMKRGPLLERVPLLKHALAGPRGSAGGARSDA